MPDFDLTAQGFRLSPCFSQTDEEPKSQKKRQHCPIMHLIFPGATPLFCSGKSIRALFRQRRWVFAGILLFVLLSKSGDELFPVFHSQLMVFH